MTRTSGWPMLWLAVAFAVFVNGPALVPERFAPYPLLRWGDVLDLFTPVVLLPLYWRLFRLAPATRFGVGSALPFVILGALWAEAQGMHLAANSIGHFLDNPVESSTQLTYMYDEVLSHYLWHFAIIGLSVLLVVRERFACKRIQATRPWLIVVAGMLYGLSFFLIVDEGQTVPLGLPFALAVVGWGLTRGRHALRHHPLTLFILVTYSVAAILLVGWGIYWRGFPEFSSLGWIQ